METNKSVIKIGNKEYELLLTTKATKEINTKFGGLENVGNKLTESKSVGESLEIVIWLIVLLVNQAILRKNLVEGTKEPEIKEEELEILTSPADLNDFTSAIMNALIVGTKRNIESEESGKNAEVE